MMSKIENEEFSEMTKKADRLRSKKTRQSLKVQVKAETVIIDSSKGREIGQLGLIAVNTRNSVFAFGTLNGLPFGDEKFDGMPFSSATYSWYLTKKRVPKVSLEINGNRSFRLVSEALINDEFVLVLVQNTGLVTLHLTSRDFQGEINTAIISSNNSYLNDCIEQMALSVVSSQFKAIIPQINAILALEF